MSDAPRKPPEAAPEVPGTTSGSPGSDAGRWITAAEASRLVGRSERGTRDWLERHGIPARGDRPRLFSESAIRAALPAPAPEAPGGASGSPRKSPEAVPEAPGSPGDRGMPIDVAYRVDGEAPAALVPLSTMLRELESFAGRIEALALEVGTLRSDLAHVTTERDELRARAEAAEAEREELRQQLQAYAESAEFAAGVRAGPAAGGGDGSLAATSGEASEGRAGVFRRWWAWLAGGGA